MKENSGDSSLNDVPGAEGQTPHPLLVVCGVLQKEVGVLLCETGLDVEVKVLDSRLHMVPEVLRLRLDALAEAAEDRRILYLYGDCDADMHVRCTRKGSARPECSNCAELLLGKERYRVLRKAGAFFLLPEWAFRWKEIFMKDLGLSTQDLARGFMRDCHTALMYIDSGVEPVPEMLLEEISDYLGLPCRIEHAGLHNLRQALTGMLPELQ